MKLKVLILHQTLKHTDEVLADYRLYMTDRTLYTRWMKPWRALNATITLVVVEVVKTFTNHFLGECFYKRMCIVRCKLLAH